MQGNQLMTLSYLVLWIMVVGLYLAVFFLYRFLGDTARRPKRKERSNRVVEKLLFTTEGIPYSLRDNGGPHMILFGSPNCELCQEIEPVVKELAIKPTSVSMILVYAASTATTRAYVQHLSEKNRFIAVADPDREITRHWRVPGTPYAVVLDGNGVVKKEGIASRPQTLRSLFAIAQSFAS